MIINDDKERFYLFVDKVVSAKGKDWFNLWSEHNPITNFHISISDDEFAAMIMDPETSHLCFIDYAAMIKKLKFDIREH